MSKYIIEINDIGIEDIKDGEKYHRVTRVPWWYISETNLNRLDLYNETESAAEQRGAEKAWELAKKISIMPDEAKKEVWGTDKYNTINLGYSYAEAAAKYETWVKENEIKVGDEVRIKSDPSKTRIITNVTKMGDGIYFSGMKPDGVVDRFLGMGNFEKTGRHFPEVAELLKKIGGE